MTKSKAKDELRSKFERFIEGDIPEYTFHRIERNPHRVFNHLGLLNAKKSCFSNNDILPTSIFSYNLSSPCEIGLMEFHPTDYCDLACKECFYREINKFHEGTKTYPFEKLYLLKKFNPRAMVLTGGGEPTVYSSDGKKFDDLINELIQLFPHLQIGLLTNGTFFPKGEWAKKIKWVRVSIDSNNKDTYREIKGFDKFDKVWGSIEKYLESSIPKVGLGYLFDNKNLLEIPNFIKDSYDQINKLKSDKLTKVNIQFRPIYPTPDKWNQGVRDMISINQIQEIKLKDEILSFAEDSKQKCEFLINQTNIEVLFHQRYKYPKFDFNYCGISLIYCLVRPQGDIYPCFVRVGDQNLLLGNVFTDNDKNIALKQHAIYQAKQTDCRERGCRQSHIINLLQHSENHLKLQEVTCLGGNYFF
ncbi:MAG: radical SAM protein [Candidatus Hodarchaeota archaeon]